MIESNGIVPTFDVISVSLHCLCALRFFVLIFFHLPSRLKPVNVILRCFTNVSVCDVLVWELRFDNSKLSIYILSYLSMRAHSHISMTGSVRFYFSRIVYTHARLLLSHQLNCTTSTDHSKPRFGGTYRRDRATA